ncbi:hypothetical protein H5410_028395 [Solanum commersonii]|uniref:Uncharacterized protein n=1 Tax=Solanum commersonii TaxID=4109 RepID=A0A9J5Z4T6_SOLCO|nr:hypothetical protein H5410_028395 [Solanum commersonii]
MEPYYTLKMKRKDLEDVYDEFSEFSLSSPARKIRRLLPTCDQEIRVETVVVKSFFDADLPPIIEEVEEPEIPIAFEQAATYPSFGSNAVNRGLVIEELPSVPENEERAIVLFKPMNTQPVHSPSNFSVKVDPQFLNGLKSKSLVPIALVVNLVYMRLFGSFIENIECIAYLVGLLELIKFHSSKSNSEALSKFGRGHEKELALNLSVLLMCKSSQGAIEAGCRCIFLGQIFWDNTANAFRLVDNEATQQDDSSSAKECLAVVPWVPSQFPSAAEAEVLSQPDVSDMMDAEDMEGVAMDIEDNSVDVEPRTAVETGAVGVNDGLHHWQQQHCMTTTQLPQNTSTPIPWYR